VEEEAGGGEEEVDFQQTVTCYQPLLREEDNVSSEDFPPRSPPFWDHTIWSHQNIFAGEEEDVLASLDVQEYLSRVSWGAPVSRMISRARRETRPHNGAASLNTHIGEKGGERRSISKSMAYCVNQ
jgi:hypothetical protein